MKQQLPCQLPVVLGVSAGLVANGSDATVLIVTPDVAIPNSQMPLLRRGQVLMLTWSRSPWPSSVRTLNSKLIPKLADIDIAACRIRDGSPVCPFLGVKCESSPGMFWSKPHKTSTSNSLVQAINSPRNYRHFSPYKIGKPLHSYRCNSSPLGKGGGSKIFFSGSGQKIGFSP